MKLFAVNNDGDCLDTYTPHSFIHKPQGIQCITHIYRNDSPKCIHIIHINLKHFRQHTIFEYMRQNLEESRLMQEYT